MLGPMPRAAVLFALAATSCIVVPAQQGASRSAPSPADPYAGAPTSASGGPPPGATAPVAPQVVSVTIRSSCGATVRVFYGDKPPYSSGTSSRISSHSLESHQFRPGDMVWIIDDHDQPIASAGVGPNTRELEIPATCNSLIAR